MMMKQNQWQILFFIMIFLTIYVLFSPEMYNSILGRSVVVFTIVLFAKYNIMLGLGLVLVAIFMYPDANYMRYMEGMETATTTATPATATAPNATAIAAKKAAVAPSKEEKKPETEPGSGTKQLQAALAEQIKTITEQMPKLTAPAAKKEGFTENKKYSGTTDRIATEERLRPRTSVTSQLYQGRGHGVSTNNFQEPSPNSSNGLGFAFLS
jgi:hypothetical protein